MEAGPNYQHASHSPYRPLCISPGKCWENLLMKKTQLPWGRAVVEDTTYLMNITDIGFKI